MENHSLSHTRWECLYHIVRIPKYRRKRLYGDLRRELGEILAALVEQMDGVEKVEGSACADHIHICLRIAPKHAVSSVVGKLKGRSAIVLFGRHPELRRVTGRDRTLWARGYYVSTVGLDEAAVRKYIRSQEEASAIEQAGGPRRGHDVTAAARRGCAAAVPSPYGALPKPPAMPGDVYYGHPIER